jgi:hypothetical protein
MRNRYCIKRHGTSRHGARVYTFGPLAFGSLTELTVISNHLHALNILADALDGQGLADRDPHADRHAARTVFTTLSRAGTSR